MCAQPLLPRAAARLLACRAAPECCPRRGSLCAALPPLSPAVHAAFCYAQVLEQLERVLQLAGSSKEQLLSCTVLIKAVDKGTAAFDRAWGRWIRHALGGGRRGCLPLPSYGLLLAWLPSSPAGPLPPACRSKSALPATTIVESFMSEVHLVGISAVAAVAAAL